MSRPNEEEVGVCGTALPKIHDNQHLHFANDDGNGKALSTLKARAAMCGCTLHELSYGGYLVCKWDYSRAVPCLRAVGDVLRQIGCAR